MKSFNERYIEFCKPFVGGLKSVYSTIVFTKIQHRTILKEQVHQLGDYSSVMGINGKYENEDFGSLDFQGSFDPFLANGDLS